MLFPRGKDNAGKRYDNPHNDEPNSQTPTNLTEQFLKRCVEEGFFIQDEHGTTYTFMHDKIEVASLSMIAPEEMERVQLEVGRILQSRLNPTQVQVQFMSWRSLAVEFPESDNSFTSFEMLGG